MNAAQILQGVSHNRIPQDKLRKVSGGVRMVVELLEDKKRWNQFVEDSPQGTLFHKWDFLKIVERHSKYRFLPYGVYSGEELRCILPFFVGRDRLGLTHMLSPPVNAQIPYLGPAFDPSVQEETAHKRDKIFAQVTGELCREIDMIAPNFVNFRTVPNFIDVRSYIWQGFTAHLMFTYAIDLEKTLDEIWASLSRRCRQKINRVNKQAPKIHQAKDASALLDLWRARFRELGIGVPLLSDSYLKELMDTFPHEMTAFIVSIDGMLVTGSVYGVMQKERYCGLIGNVSTRKDLGLNEFLEWEIIRRAKSEGFKTLDLLGSPTQGISEFKSKFDPVLEPFCYLRKTDKLGKVVNFAVPKLAGSIGGKLKRALNSDSKADCLTRLPARAPSISSTTEREVA